MDLELGKSPVKEFNFVEFIDNNDIKSIRAYIDAYINDELDSYNYAEMNAKRYYDTVADQMTAYSKKETKGVVPVQYIKPKHGIGRVFPKKALGVVSFSKQLRNALIKNKYYDFDLSNCQPELIRNFAIQHGLENTTISNYCECRDEIFEEISLQYNIKKSKIKKLFLRLCFFGTFKGWLLDNKLDYNLEPTDFINDFTEELKGIAKVIKTHNPKLYKTAYDQNKENGIGSMFALFIQEQELRVVNFVIKKLMGDTTLCESKGYDNVVSYEWDGIKLLKENVDRFGGCDKVIELLNEYLVEYKLDGMKFEVKPIESNINLSEFPPDEFEESSDYIDFHTFKKEFELNNFKIKKSGTYGTHIDGELFIKTKGQMIESHEHEIYHETSKKGDITDKCFINKWMRTPSLRMYDDVQAYPPGGLICPSNHYNIWVPFDAEKISEFEFDQTAVDCFMNHVKTLCGHDDNIFHYMKLWLAQMFQHPGRKPESMPIFISKEGAGKGSLMYVLEQLIGKARVVETANANDLLGDFNGLLADAFLVCFNELSKSQLNGKSGKLKEFITDRKISINKKFQAHKLMNSYHRAIGCTNKGNPIEVDENSRRWLLIRSSDEFCGDKDYFAHFYKTMKSDDAIASIYKYLMEVDISEFYDMKLPKSKHQMEISEMNRAIPQQWLIDYVKEVSAIETSVVYLTNKQIYSLFIAWRDANGFKYEVSSSSIACELVNSNIPGFEKQPNGKPKKLDIDMIKDYYKINTQAEDISDDLE